MGGDFDQTAIDVKLSARLLAAVVVIKDIADDSSVAAALFRRFIGWHFHLAADLFAFIVNLDFADEFGVAIELWVGEEPRGLRVVQDVEIELVVVAADSGATADNLFEIDDRIDHARQDDVAAGRNVDAGG